MGGRAIGYKIASCKCVPIGPSMVVLISALKAGPQPTKYGFASCKAVTIGRSMGLLDLCLRGRATGAIFLTECIFTNGFLLENCEICGAAGANFLKIESC